jgi:hypothetical protein
MFGNEINLIILLIVFAMLITFFVFEVFALEVTALTGTAILLLFGVITIEDALSGFSNKAVITIGAMFILSRSLVKTGFLEVLTNERLKINIAPIVITALLLKPERASSIVITPKSNKIAVPVSAVTSNANTSNTKNVISIAKTIKRIIKFISFPNITGEVT